MTHNTTYYALGDATVCCSWGTHGVDSATGNSFVLGSYLAAAPAVVEDGDVQPLTQQLARSSSRIPLHDPLLRGRNVKAPGNTFPGWMRPASMRPGDGGGCGGTGVATTYFLLEPTNTNPKNNIPASKAFVARVGATTYHLQNVALLPWYPGTAEGLGSTLQLSGRAGARRSAPSRARHAVDVRRGRWAARPARPTVTPVPLSGPPNGHQLIGYWAGYGGAGSTIPLREVSPQWDVILIAFSTPDRNAPEGTMQFRTPAGLDTEQFKADIAYMKSQGKKVMISLGGGGQHFTLADPKRVPNFVSSVTRIAPPTFPAALVPHESTNKLFNIDIPLKRLLNGTSELEYLQPIKAGDVISVTAKLTRLRQMPGAEGPTLFMFTEMTYTNQRGEVVVKGKNTYIKY